jgi:hypothetical protein
VRTIRKAPLLAAALLACAACAGPSSLAGAPSGRPGWSQYHVRDLWFRAPASWRATGDARHATVLAPDERARLEITVPEQPHVDEHACLRAADERLASAASGLERARRHPAALAGRPAQALEGDERGWHVWAIAACDGGTQYQIFFTAATPASAETMDVWQTLLRDARVGGEV